MRGASRVYGWLLGRRGGGCRGAVKLRPEVEAFEGRRLMSVGGAAVHAAPAHQHAAEVAVKNPLLPYRIFVGKLTEGPHAGTTFKGPLVLGYDGRIQVIGFFYPKKGGRDEVVGQITGTFPSLRINLPGGSALEASGTGYLAPVRGGLPGGDSLVGHGNLTGPAGADFGHWSTVKPAQFWASLKAAQASST